MRFDFLTMFSDDQALTGSSADSTKTIDMKTAGIAENELFVAARFTDNAHGCTKLAVMGSDDGNTFREVSSTAVTDTTAGAGVSVRLPQGCPRHLKLVYTGGSMKGKVTAGITLQAPSPRGKRIGDYAAN